jgi:hypothetical protein
VVAKPPSLPFDTRVLVYWVILRFLISSFATDPAAGRRDGGGFVRFVVGGVHYGGEAMSLKFRVQDRIEGLMGALFGILVVAPCIFFVLAGAMVILVEFVKWLKTDVWVTMSLRDGLTRFGYSLPDTPTGYPGVYHAVSSALDSPFTLWMILPVPLIWAIVWTYVLNLLFLVMQSVSSTLCHRFDRKHADYRRNL